MVCPLEFEAIVAFEEFCDVDGFVLRKAQLGQNVLCAGGARGAAAHYHGLVTNNRVFSKQRNLVQVSESDENVAAPSLKNDEALHVLDNVNSMVQNIFSSAQFAANTVLQTFLKLIITLVCDEHLGLF